MIAFASAPSRAQCTVPPARVTLSSSRASCSGSVAIARALIAAPASRSASQSSSSATAAARLARIAVVALPRLRRSCGVAERLAGRRREAHVSPGSHTVPHDAERAAAGALPVVGVPRRHGRGRPDARAADAQSHPRDRGRRAAGRAHARAGARSRAAARAAARAGACSRRGRRCSTSTSTSASTAGATGADREDARGPERAPRARGARTRRHAVARHLPLPGRRTARSSTTCAPTARRTCACPPFSLNYKAWWRGPILMVGDGRRDRRRVRAAGQLSTGAGSATSSGSDEKRVRLHGLALRRPASRADARARRST